MNDTPLPPLGAPEGTERTTPFRATYARPLAAWSLLAGSLVLIVLGADLALGATRIGALLLLPALPYAVLVSLTVVIRRRGHTLPAASDRRWAAATVACALAAGVPLLYLTGGPWSPLLIMAPVVPFTLRLLGTVWFSIGYAAALAVSLTAMVVLDIGGNGSASLIGETAVHTSAAGTMLIIATMAGVTAAIVLADMIARMLRRREAEAVAFSDKMNLRAEKLALLLQVGTVLSRHGSFEEVTREILDLIHAHFGAEATVLYLYRPGSSELRVAEARGDAGARESRETVLARATLTSREARLWPSTEPGNVGLRSTMLAPLVVEETAYGALKIVAPVGVSFNQSKLRLLSTIATQLATTLRTASVYQTTNAELSRVTAELSALTSFTRQVSASFELRAMCRSLLDTAAMVTASHYANVTLLAQREGDENITLFRNYDPETEFRLRSTDWRHSPGIYGRAIRSGQPVLVNDVLRDPEYLPVVPEVRSKMCVPIVVAGKVEGMVNLESRDADAFMASDTDFVVALCESTAVAIRNAHLYREVKEMAVKDGLTGLYNRTYLYEALQTEVERAQRYQTDLSLVLMDVDDFKLYNDRHGHTAGDEVLRWLGQTLTARTRRSDIVARYGGEELAVIMPETPCDHAQSAAEKLREAIESRQPAHWPSPVTVSVGVAAYPADGTTPVGLIDTADERMYQAKRGGKNQVVSG